MPPRRRFTVPLPGGGSLALGDRALIMGVVNVTPDSFSDGGRLVDPGSAIEAGARMADEGADLIDVGGESTRPGAEPVPRAEEMRRVLPVLATLREHGLRTPVSIDTRHADVAEAALDAGAALVNDVSALSDPAMARLVAERGVPVVLMHLPSPPRVMQVDPHYDDVVSAVGEALAAARDRALGAGIAPAQILLDPGLGFGKRTGAGVEDNLTLLSHLPHLLRLGHPLVVGASRKRFLGNVSGAASVEKRLAASLAAALAATWAGAHVLRVHDVEPTLHAVRTAAALDPSEWNAAWSTGPGA